ncbi:MAG TPA: outer membrane beta-barrel protein [Sphingomicrobium sp.]|nr:outer membrane beta-barrel protein [Sphingomicrobium sp.]
MLATVAALAIAIPTSAQSGTPYVGIEAGLAVGRSNDVDEVVVFTTTQTPSSPPAPAGPADQEFDDTFIVPYRNGFDVAVMGGYDFGFLRIELELARKQAGLRDLRPDETADGFVGALNSALNRPSAAPDPGAPGLAPLTGADFDLSGKMRVSSAMVDALLDLKLTKKATLYAGGGYGRSWARALGDADSAWAWQYILGARYKLSDHVELGIKHRYFNSGIVKLRHGGIEFAGNPNRLTITPPGGTATDVDQTTSALVMPEIEGEFRARSYMASLIYNF